MTVRLGIVGAGYWAREAHIASLEHEDSARWTAITSAGLHNARAVAEVIDIEHVAADWRELVRSDDVDAVVVAAPAPLHRPVTLAALAAGKHVLCEAPLGCDAAEAREMLAAAEAAELVHAYVRPRPFLYGGAEVCQRIADGSIGDPWSATLAWRGNTWFGADPAHTWRTRTDMGPPVLAGVTASVLACVLGPAARVSAVLRRRGPAPESGLAGAPDTLTGTMVTRGGVDVAFQAGASPLEVPGSGLCVYGSEGAIAWDWAPPATVRIARNGDREWEELPLALEGDLARAWPCTRGFVYAIESGHPAVPDFRAGVDELVCVDAMLRSNESGGVPVDVDAPDA